MSSSAGAALPDVSSLDLDLVLDTLQEVLANPDPYMEALGVRAKRHAETENHSGFKEFPIPFIGAEFGVKYKDESNRMKGGEAYIHVDDLQSLIPAAHSKLVKVHVKFDGGPSTVDGLFSAEFDYHLEHKDGDGTEEGSVQVTRELRGGRWHTHVKTEAHPFSGETIIPKRISSMELDLESDRHTSLKAKYFNAFMGRDLTVDIARVPGKSIKAIITNKGVVSTVEGLLSKPSSGEVKVDMKADIRGVKYTGEISGKMTAGKPTKVKVEVKKGSETVLQLLFEVKVSGTKGMFRGKYSVMGGKVAQGKVNGKWDGTKVEVEAGPYKISVDLALGTSIKIKAEKGGVEMWTYETLREDKSSGSVMLWEAKSEMNLNPDSMLHGAIQKFYPFGAFLKRTNTMRIYVDHSQRNALLPQFKIDFDVVKDGSKVVDLTADTTTSPYKFVADAPNVFSKMGLKSGVTVTVDHQKGKSLNIMSNIAGGVQLNVNHAPNNLGGRTINVLANKAGAQMFKYHGETSKVDNAAMLKVGLKGEFDLSPDSILYKTVVGKYKILTPFAKRTSDLEFFLDKQNMNTVMNKFYAKAKIDKDGTNVANIDISTNVKPYKFFMYLPAVLGKLRPGMEVVDVTLAHELHKSIDLKVNHPTAKWKGFKIVRNGNHYDIEWNGKKLGKGDYKIEGNRFSTTQTLEDGRSLTTTVTWKNTYSNSNSHLLDNKVNINLDGTERRLNLDLEWDMSKVPDMDLNTPESGHLRLMAEGNNRRWGDYSISREVSLASAARVLSLDVSGMASFSAGLLAARSPVVTSVVLEYDVDKTDLAGHFSKVMAGKEYSITFPKGSFRMPSVKLGA